MRIAILISGILTTLIILFGSLLKLVHFPGGSFLSLVGTVFFLLSFLPLLTISRMKNDQLALGKAAAGLGLFAGWALFSGLLFGVMRWPGGAMLLLVGIFFSLIFLVLHIISLFNPASKQKKFGIPEALILFALIGLTAARSSAKVSHEVVKKEVLAYIDLQSEKAELLREQELLKNAIFEAGINTDSISPDEMEGLKQLGNNTSDFLGYFQDLRAELISREEGIYLKVADTLSPWLVSRPDDYDTPTHYFIGENPENPTGKAAELYEKLKRYRDIIQQYGGTLNIDLSPSVMKDGEEQPWAKAHFYHARVFQALGELSKFEIAVISAANEIYRRKLKVKQ